MAEWGNGIVIDPDDPLQNPFKQGRSTTFTPRPVWENLLKIAFLLFLLDIGFRRIDIEKRQIKHARNSLIFWKTRTSGDEPVVTKLSALKKSREQSKNIESTPDSSSGTINWKPSETELKSDSNQSTSQSEKLDDSSNKKKKSENKADKNQKSDQPQSGRVTGKLLAARRKAKDNENQ